MTGSGQIVTFEIEGGKAAAFRFLNALKLIRISNNLGDAKSLITHPATTTHQRLKPEARAELGISDGMLRLSVGLEVHADLVADIDRALAAARKELRCAASIETRGAGHETIYRRRSRRASPAGPRRRDGLRAFRASRSESFVPFAAGGNVDVTARGSDHEQFLGQPVVNRAGAGGMIGAGAAMSAKPDGHTLLMGSNSTLSVGPNVFPNWPHDPIKGVTPISNIQVVPFSSGRRPFTHQVGRGPGEAGQGEAGRDHPGSFGYRQLQSSGVRAVPDVDGDEIHPRSVSGAAPAMNDLLGGQVQTFFDQASTSVPQVEGGTVRALAVTSAKRMPTLPTRQPSQKRA